MQGRYEVNASRSQCLTSHTWENTNMQKDLWMRCASSFYVGMHEWRTCKWCWTKCDPSSVFGNLTGTFLPNVNVSGEHDRCCVVINLNVNQYSKDKRRPKGISNLKGKRSQKNSQPKYSLSITLYDLSYLVFVQNSFYEIYLCSYS